MCAIVYDPIRAHKAECVSGVGGNRVRKTRELNALMCCRNKVWEASENGVQFS